MWTPLPQVLEECLYRIYQDHGWELVGRQNHRLNGEITHPLAFPTLNDLFHKVDEVVTQLGYDERITADIRAALRTRINGLRAGSKGKMFDTRYQMPMQDLLGRPTILELEGMGNDDDKAFVMALLVIRITEHWRVNHPTQLEQGRLRQLLVIEEAHRLLARSERVGFEGEANPRATAVETFANLLAEIRAYGQGIIIADQVPVRLAPDVVKNTNLKIVHRTVSIDDRLALAGAMAMSEEQATTLSHLSPGEAVVFGTEDDAPIKIKVPKGERSDDLPDDASVAEYMAAKGLAGDRTKIASCSPDCSGDDRACETARVLAAVPALRRVFSKIVLSVTEDQNALHRLWRDFTDVVEANRPRTVSREALCLCLAGHASNWYAQRRGAQAGWSYTDTAELSDRIRQLFVAKAMGHNITPAYSEFHTLVLALHARSHGPFPACDTICQQKPKVCLYRYAAADLIASGRLTSLWKQADANDANTRGARRRETWELCQDAGYELREFARATDTLDDAQRTTARAAAERASLCFGQQMIAFDDKKQPDTARRITARLLIEARGLDDEPNTDR
jgi:hypothetical protein